MLFGQQGIDCTNVIHSHSFPHTLPKQNERRPYVDVKKQYVRFPQRPTKETKLHNSHISCVPCDPSIIPSSAVLDIESNRLASSSFFPSLLLRRIILVPRLTGLQIIARHQSRSCLARNLSLPPPIVLVSGDGQDIPFAEREFLGNRSLVHIHRSCWESLAKRQHTRYQPKTHHNARSPFHPL